MQWQKQGGKFTTNQKVKVDFFIPKFSATTIMTWKYHMDNSTEAWHEIILGIDMLTSLVLDNTFSKNIIVRGDRAYKG